MAEFPLAELRATSASPDLDLLTRYILRDEVAIEDFADGSLVLPCEQLRLVQLNPVARDVLALLDGERTLRQVAEAVAQTYGEPFERVLSDVLELMADLEVQGVVERNEEQRAKGKEDINNMKRYLANPDVSCREEGPDGALLFNPDTDAILVINPTGLLLWKALSQPRTQEELVANLLETFEDVPTDRVATDVEEFLQTLQPGGFIGEVLENDAP